MEGSSHLAHFPRVFGDDGFSFPLIESKIREQGGRLLLGPHLEQPLLL
jgi:hypothetical protein